MSADTNPYQSPPEITSSEAADPPPKPTWAVLFWGAMGLTVCGCLSVFLPNVPPLGFLFTAALLFTITIIASKQDRKRAIFGLVLCLSTTLFISYQLRMAQARAARDRAIKAQQSAYEAEKAAMEASLKRGQRSKVIVDRSEARP